MLSFPQTARAHWVTRDTILWLVGGSSSGTYRLHYDPAGALRLGASGVEGGMSVPLRLVGSMPDPTILRKFPHLAGYAVFKLDADVIELVPAMLKGQVVVAAYDGLGQVSETTALQIAGVLDDLYTYNGPLGITYDHGIPTLRVWAPTAQSVALWLFVDSHSPHSERTIPMTHDPLTGVWSVTGAPDWTGRFYVYDIDVFVGTTDRIEKNLVTDPYSVSLATNSRRSQIVNLDSPELIPAGWRQLRKLRLDAPDDIVLYELHVRDFSINDMTVSSAHRGTYRAFTETSSDGMRHLKALAQAGLTHIHLLPVFDHAVIDEDRTTHATVDIELLGSYPADSAAQQAAVMAIREEDGYNWGYEPYHFTTPEGSYATDPDGATRTREFREMVKALSDIGLRVVMDVVYNHTHASGQSGHSVLDRIVPGYYHRLNPTTGAVETSTCCQNTATEHAMMEKLMVDSLVTWAKVYKVDGFRFDLMGHHMVDNMSKARDTLRALTVEQDGVDGSTIYLYGEGWNFGEVVNGARGANATQTNMAGTGIGTFSDRLRDAVRGGGPFNGLQEQGFATGLWYAPNGIDQGPPEWQRARLLALADQIRLGLAGNLQQYEFVGFAGTIVSGKTIDYNGQPAGYALEPREVITYVEAHDNDTFFDAIQLKAPIIATLEQRVRMQNLGASLVLLAQGIPFLHAGQDMLRSKSLDRNSYNSGDWFNRLDWSYASNNWGVGLPPGENERNWPIMRPLLGNPALRPGKPDILSAVNHVREMLRIRKSSSLFRLRTAAAIKARLEFLDTGPEQLPALIVMRLQNIKGELPNEAYTQIVVVFNAAFSVRTFAAPSLRGIELLLHPIQATSYDRVVRTAEFDSPTGMFVIPAQTTAVFVERT